MQLYNVLTKKEITVDGEVKKLWNKVGIIKISQNGRMYLQLFHLPNVEFYVVKLLEQSKQKNKNLLETEDDLL